MDFEIFVWNGFRLVKGGNVVLDLEWYCFWEVGDICV